ncbi:MAG: F0F1 ATP synthase subunit B [Gemmatimonadales bacterium]
MFALILLLQHAAEGGEAEFSPFSIKTGMMFWTLIIFGLMLGILWKWVWPVIVRSVEEREQRIAGQLEHADKLNAEAKAALEEHNRLLAKSKDEAQALIAEAKSVAEKEREHLLEKTRQEQEQLLERAKREIEAERERAVAGLRREAVDLSLAAAAKLIRQKLDSETDRKVVEDYLASLEDRA